MGFGAEAGWINSSLGHGSWNLLKRLPLDIFGRGLLQKLAIAVGSRAHVWA